MIDQKDIQIGTHGEQYGKTVLVIAHRMRTVEAADRIVVLDHGVVAEQGTPEELLGKEDGIFRRMTELQAQGASYRI